MRAREPLNELGAADVACNARRAFPANKSIEQLCNRALKTLALGVPHLHPLTLVVPTPTRLCDLCGGQPGGEAVNDWRGCSLCNYDECGVCFATSGSTPATASAELPGET